MLMLLTCLSKTQLWLFFTRLSIGEIALGCMSWFCGLYVMVLWAGGAEFHCDGVKLRERTGSG